MESTTPVRSRGEGENDTPGETSPPVHPGGFVSEIIQNAVEPGVNTSVLIFINVVFTLLLLTVAVILVIDFNMMLLAFGILAAGLMIGINVFIVALGEGQGTSTEVKTKDE